jgi:uncharacterized protein (TIGR03118 family)
MNGICNGRRKSRGMWLTAALGVALLAAGGADAKDPTFQVTNLVSDGAVPATTVDPKLINPWGVSSAPGGPFWVSDNGSEFTTLYTGAGAKVSLTVAVPGDPTGQVFNSATGQFKVTNGSKTGAATFIFDGEGGTISAWAPSVNFGTAITAVDNSASGAVYKGLAIGSTGGQTYLYAADFGTGEVEMYNSSYGLVKTFTDPNVAAGYAPFNVQVLDGTLYVTFALQDSAKHDDVAGAGNGYVDAFSLDGTFEQRIVSQGGEVDSPWGLDIAPSSFRAFAGDLLVGNFGDGTISVFNPTTDAYEGKLTGLNGAPLVEGDLWALVTGNGGSGGDADKVYFTAGVANEADGLLGSISAVPEPEAWALMLIGFGLIGGVQRALRHDRRVARSEAIPAGRALG